MVEDLEQPFTLTANGTNGLKPNGIENIPLVNGAGGNH